MATVKVVRKLVNPSRRKRAKLAQPYAKKAPGIAAAFKKAIREIAQTKTRARKATARAKKAVQRAANTRHRKSRATRPNPAPLMVTLGAVNPNGGGTTGTKRRKRIMATTRKRRTTARRRVARRNPKRVVVVMAPKRRTSTRRRRRNPVVRTKVRTRTVYLKPNRRRTRRNPQIFGQRIGVREGLEMILGGLIGVTVTKFLPTMLPAQLTGGNAMRTVVSFVSAFAAAWGAQQISPTFAYPVLFGGMMQAGSVALNAFLPGVGSQIGLSGYRRGMGQFVNGGFSVPQIPVFPPPPPPPAPVGNGVSGVSRAFRPAF